MIFNKTRSVLSLKNFSEQKEKVEHLTKNSTLKILKPTNAYQSDDDSIRISNRANNETNSSASSQNLLNMTSQKLLNSFHDLSFEEESVVVKNENSGQELSGSGGSNGDIIHPVLML